jgi:hypothetical protein
MCVVTTLLFGTDSPTVVTWRFGKETARGKGKGKEEGLRGSGDNSNGTRKGGSRKGREERRVVYSKDDAALHHP